MHLLVFFPRKKGKGGKEEEESLLVTPHRSKERVRLGGGNATPSSFSKKRRGKRNWERGQY